MKVMVVVRRVYDPTGPITLMAENRLERSAVPGVIDPCDEMALDMAQQLRETGTVTEIVTVGIAPIGEEKAWKEILRTALARGADRALLGSSSDTTDPLIIAGYIAEIVCDESPDLVLLGRKDSDSGDPQVGPRLAGMLDWPVATEVVDIMIAGEQIQAIRETDTGRETLATTLPAVVTCDSRGREPQPIPLPSILQAREKPLSTIPSLQIEGDTSYQIVGYSPVRSRSHCQMFDNLREVLSELVGLDVVHLMNRLNLTDDSSSDKLPYVGMESEFDALAWIAGTRGWPLISAVQFVEKTNGAWLYKRAVFSGRFWETVAVPDTWEHIIVLAGGTRTEGMKQRVADLIASEAPRLAPLTDRVPLEGGFPDMGVARIVVAGGRGLKEAVTFERLVGGLAKALGGAMAASGGAVNAGIAPTSLLVGQTGRRIAPDLYIALGISGVDQHVAGFRDARRVVAINTDAKAPIFGFADIGLVADLNTVVPEWIARLRQ